MKRRGKGENLEVVGAVRAPIYGELMLDYCGATVLFSALCGVCLLAFGIYYCNLVRGA